MKIFTLLLLSLLSLTLSANANKLSPTPYNIAKIYIGHGQPYFLEVGADDCPGCNIMGKLLFTVKEESPKLNILYINIGKDRMVGQELGVQMIPTQIIYDAQGKEVYRHTGVLKEMELDDILEKYKF